MDRQEIKSELERLKKEVEQRIGGSDDRTAGSAQDGSDWRENVRRGVEDMDKDKGASSTRY